MELSEVQKVIAWYGSRCSLQNGRGSTTPGVDFNKAVEEIEEIIDLRVSEALSKKIESDLRAEIWAKGI